MPFGDRHHRAALRGTASLINSGALPPSAAQMVNDPSAYSRFNNTAPQYRDFLGYDGYPDTEAIASRGLDPDEWIREGGPVTGYGRGEEFRRGMVSERQMLEEREEEEAMMRLAAREEEDMMEKAMQEQAVMEGMSEGMMGDPRMRGDPEMMGMMNDPRMMVDPRMMEGGRRAGGPRRGPGRRPRGYSDPGMMSPDMMDMMGGPELMGPGMMNPAMLPYMLGPGERRGPRGPRQGGRRRGGRGNPYY